MRLAMCALFILLVGAGCQSASSSKAAQAGASPFRADGHRKLSLRAESVVFHVSANPQVNSHSFRSEITISKRADIISFKIQNFANKGKRADATVILAISGGSAGFGIYDSSGATLGEYGGGVIVGQTANFEKPITNGKIVIRWLIGDEILMSLIETFDQEQNMVHAELTTYRVR